MGEIEAVRVVEPAIYRGIIRILAEKREITGLAVPSILKICDNELD
jgi:hypothetical protein